MREFARLCGVHPAMQALDVGVIRLFGECYLANAATRRATTYHLPEYARAAEPEDDRQHLVFAVGRRLPFRDQSFHIVFSNSIIENVRKRINQQQLAAEIARVGQGFWVKTPNNFVPVEQHLMTPVIHWAPRSMQAWLVPYVTFWGILSKATRQEREFYFEHFLNDIRLLDYSGLKQLFLDATVRHERFFGLTKSLVAMRLMNIDGNVAEHY